MRPATLIYTYILITSSNAAPVSSLSQTIIKDAGGDVPNGGAPPQLSSNGVANFKLANFIENIEVQFFNQALTSLANDKAFTSKGTDGVSIQDVITKVAAQEQVHKATIEGALMASNAITITECKTITKVSNTAELLTRANIITSISIGVIIALSASLATTDPALFATSTRILEIEARQDGLFHLSEDVVPNVAPFETQIPGIWAYNLILSFVDPTSYPTLLPISMLATLNIITPALYTGVHSSQPLTVTFHLTKTWYRKGFFILDG